MQQQLLGMEGKELYHHRTISYFTSKKPKIHTTVMNWEDRRKEHPTNKTINDKTPFQMTALNWVPLRPQELVIHQEPVIHQECQQKYVSKVPGIESQRYREHSREWVTGRQLQVETESLPEEM